MVTCGFFNSVYGDRKYDADQMSDFYTGIVTQGVFQHVDNGLEVTAGTGLTVSVNTGRAIIQNKWVKNDTPLVLELAPAPTTYGRFDRVVLKYDSNNRNVQIIVKTGTPAGTPGVPELVREGGIYEMCLADIDVEAGATSVTVTDTRSDPNLCGWAAVAQATSGEVDQMLNDLKTGFDGSVYSTPAAEVQGSDQLLQDQVNVIVDTKEKFAKTLENMAGSWPNGGFVHPTDGHIEPNASWVTSDTFAVTPGNTYFVSGVTGMFYGFYTSNNSFISGSGVSSILNNTVPITAPDNAAYMKISVQKIEVFSTQITDGSIPISAGSLLDEYNLLRGACSGYGVYVYEGGIVVKNKHLKTAMYYKPIAITKGKKYRYSNIWAYFSFIVYTDVTIDKFYTGTDSFVSGSFTAAYDGYVYISVSTGTDSGLFYFGEDNLLTSYIQAESNSLHGLRMHDKYSQSQGLAFSLRAGLADLDDAEDGTIYRLQPLSLSYIAHIPSDFPTDGLVPYYLITLSANMTDVNENVTGHHQKQQLLIASTMDVSYRRDWNAQTSQYGAWAKTVLATQETIYKTSDYNGSLIEAVKAAEQTYGSVVLLDNQSYDMVQEFIDYYGETFFTNYSRDNADGYGLVITNGITLRGNSDTTITCDPGTYVTAQNNLDNVFSPLMLAGDCSLENLKIVCDNTKYCVHDDWYTKTVKARHEYHNCVMIHEETDHRCIGGGLTNSMEILIEDCCFECVEDYPVSYHNCVNSGAESRLIIKNNYFKNGGVHLGSYGSSTTVTMTYLSGNSWETDPYVNIIDPDHYTTVNMAYTSWNNDTREQ